MQSNRLVVTLNKEMQIGFERGLNQVYENSNLVNEFVVKPSFLLETMQSLWVTFKDAESNATLTLKPTLLAERKVTAINSDKQDVDNDVAQIAQTVSTGYEYYTLLPKEIMQAPGTWYFSVEICQVPERTNDSEDDIAELTQIKTSDIASFTVYSSLAGEGPNGSAPSDLDVVNLYNTAVEAAANAEISASKAQEAAQTVNASNYAPYVGEDGNWWQYDKAQQKYVNTDVPAQGPQGVQGPVGPRGPQGERGSDGTSFEIRGSVDSAADLPQADESLLGAAYYVGTTAPRDVYALVRDEQGAVVWQNQGKLQGPPGPQGEQGAPGVQGPRGLQGLQGRNIYALNTGYSYTQEQLADYSAPSRGTYWDIAGPLPDGIKVGDVALIRMTNTTKNGDCWIVSTINAIEGNRVYATSDGLLDKGNTGPAPDTSKFVTTDTDQTVTGYKKHNSIGADTINGATKGNAIMRQDPTSGNVILGSSVQQLFLYGNQDRPKYQQSDDGVLKNFSFLSDLTEVVEGPKDINTVVTYTLTTKALTTVLNISYRQTTQNTTAAFTLNFPADEKLRIVFYRQRGAGAWQMAISYNGSAVNVSTHSYNATSISDKVFVITLG